MNAERLENWRRKDNKMAQTEKEKRIKAELKRISSYFEKVPTNKKEVVRPLLQNASFMKVTLEDLQELINEEGVIDQYQNGANQSGLKQSASLQSYNALVKNYASVIKSLCSLLPKEEAEQGSGKLGEFLRDLED